MVYYVLDVSHFGRRPEVGTQEIVILRLSFSIEAYFEASARPFNKNQDGKEGREWNWKTPNPHQFSFCLNWMLKIWKVSLIILHCLIYAWMKVEFLQKNHSKDWKGSSIIHPNPISLRTPFMNQNIEKMGTYKNRHFRYKNRLSA